FFFQAEDGIRDFHVTGVQTCALPISVEKTALAEAEVEYEDITSTQIDVAFEITESPIPELVGAHAVVWTTTPWTIPVNQALAYGPEVEYRSEERRVGNEWRARGAQEREGETGGEPTSGEVRA